MSIDREYGKILKIYDDHTVLVDLGEDDGVRKGQQLVVVAEGEEIRDPDNGASLGSFEWEKARLRITRVQKSFAVAESHDFVEAKISPVAAYQQWLGLQVQTKKIQVPFPIDDEQVSPPEEPIDMKVRPGDIVRVVARRV
jgi:hypothetical protein